MKTKTLVIDVLRKHAKSPLPDDEGKLLALHFLDDGTIDSMGLMEMVVELEDAIGDQFTAEDLQSPQFQTVAGLIAMVESRAK